MQRIWFKAKRFGWGWTPATWQAWVIIIIYVGVIALAAMLLRRQTKIGVIEYITTVVAASVFLIITCWKMGEKPKWRWGDPKR